MSNFQTIANFQTITSSIGIGILVTLLLVGLTVTAVRSRARKASPGWAAPDSATGGSRTADLDWKRLRELIEEHFNDGELQTLCYDLEIEYEDLSGQGKRAKVTELIRAFNRKDRLPELIAYCLRERPHALWSDAVRGTYSPEPPEVPSGPDASTHPDPRPSRRRWRFWIPIVLAATLVGRVVSS